MKKNKIETILKAAAGIIFLIVVMTVIFASGYFITNFIYKYTGNPPDIWSHVFSGLAGMTILILISTTVRLFHPHDGGFTNPNNQILQAMTRIAQGDFDVFIEPNERRMRSELVDGVNKMAHDLGSMEQLRQEFISNVSHELQSPLTSISGFAALLQKDNVSAEQRQHYLKIIETESRRLSKLSDNLLKLSALETGTESPLSVREYRIDRQIENITLTLEPQWAAKNLSVEAELEKLTYNGDEELLAQVWINLLHNAIKFTPENGEIRITLKKADCEVCCQVEDTGMGVAPENQMHIFERFYKVDKARDRSLGGNGLGLALVKKIIELHGGIVTVESEVGKGTAFTVKLPV